MELNSELLKNVFQNQLIKQPNLTRPSFTHSNSYHSHFYV